MSKKAIVIILILIIVPLVFTMIYALKWYGSREVVAEYGDTVDTVIYGDKTLKAVGDNDKYLAEAGKFLGKVNDKIIGAGLYTLKNDKSGEIFAVISEKGLVIYTESGRLPAEAYSGKKITRIFFDSFNHETFDADEISVYESIFNSTEEQVLYTPGENDNCVVRTVNVCYDDCAVSTVSPGKLYYFKGTGMWYFLSSECEKKATEEADTSGETTYALTPVTTKSQLKLLQSEFLTDKKTETTK